MSKTFIPKNYKCQLSLYETQKAIGLIKRLFEDKLSGALHLHRVSAPLFVEGESGLNDNLSGNERPVTFDIPAAGTHGQVVHSLAKWKRLALWKYGFQVGDGLYTDMNAIRRDDVIDNLHSIYVDQWDWEKVISKEQRNEEFLKEIVDKIVEAICSTAETIQTIFPDIKTNIKREVSFVTTQELEDMYPDFTAKERENAYVKEHKTVFIMKIGGALKSGKPHDNRAPDYDDWDLNGDIFFWDETLQCACEISSMGIRVDEEAMDRQLSIANCDDRRELFFHELLLQGKLPLTIGGGIGQSRLCLLILGKAHIGEVQASIWDKETKEICEKAGIILL